MKGIFLSHFDGQIFRGAVTSSPPQTDISRCKSKSWKEESIDPFLSGKKTATRFWEQFYMTYPNIWGKKRTPPKTDISRCESKSWRRKYRSNFNRGKKQKTAFGKSFTNFTKYLEVRLHPLPQTDISRCESKSWRNQSLFCP